MELKTILKSIKESESQASTFLGIVVVFVVGFLMFRYFQGANPTPASLTTENQAQTNETQAQTNQNEYEVKKGDSLWKIALTTYGSGYEWKEIASLNNLSNPDVIDEGMKLKMPNKAASTTVEAQNSQESITEDKYTTVKGDSLWKIAVRAYGDGYKWVEIAKANNLTENPNLIFSGKELSIPR